MVDNILEENRRRNKTDDWDPLTGCGSVGDRFRLYLPDYPIPEQFLPESMRELPLVTALAEAGSVARFCEADPQLLTPARVTETFARLRCRHDFPFWAATLAYIKNKEGGPDVLFRLNPPQRKLVCLFEEMRLAGKGIKVVMLKARQWGGSTCTQLYMAWLQLMHEVGLNSLIVAHQKSASEQIKDMFDRMMLSYPLDYLCGQGDAPSSRERKMTAVGSSGVSFRIPRRGCKVTIGSAERPDSSRGGDYALVHMSEVALWPSSPAKRPEDLVRACLGGQKGGALSMTVLESTAKGSGDFFHGEYEAARKGIGAYRPLFVAWFEIPRYSLALDDAGEFARRLYEGRHDTSAPDDRHEPGAYLWRLWEEGATLEGIAWYVAERARYSSHARMASEYPSDDVEAFAHSGLMVFDRCHVRNLGASCRPPLEQGELIAAGTSGPEALRNISFVANPSGCLRIWKQPDGMRWANRYMCVVDIGGRAEKSDWTVALVLDRKPLCEGKGPEVVAQWRGHDDFDRLPWICGRLAKYYGDALLVIESNTVTNFEARLGIPASSDTFFSLLHEHYGNLYMRASDPDDAAGGAGLKYGFHTNMRTKKNVVQHLTGIVRDCGYLERDADCISEFLTYEEKPSGAYGAVEGRHDDMLMTRAIGLYVSDFEMEAPRALLDAPVGYRPRQRPDLLF